MSASDGDPMHAQLAKLSAAVERVGRAVCRVDARLSFAETGLPRSHLRRCIGCAIDTLAMYCPWCSGKTQGATE